jgi:hypothetical protein
VSINSDLDYQEPAGGADDGLSIKTTDTGASTGGLEIEAIRQFARRRALQDDEDQQSGVGIGIDVNDSFGSYASMSALGSLSRFGAAALSAAQRLALAAAAPAPGSKVAPSASASASDADASSQWSGLDSAGGARRTSARARAPAEQAPDYDDYNEALEPLDAFLDDPDPDPGPGPAYAEARELRPGSKGSVVSQSGVDVIEGAQSQSRPGTALGGADDEGEGDDDDSLEPLAAVPHSAAVSALRELLKERAQTEREAGRSFDSDDDELLGDDYEYQAPTAAAARELLQLTDDDEGDDVDGLAEYEHLLMQQQQYNTAWARRTKTRGERGEVKKRMVGGLRAVLPVKLCICKFPRWGKWCIEDGGDIITNLGDSGQKKMTLVLSKRTYGATSTPCRHLHSVHQFRY